MKKILALSFALTYLLVSSGILLELHHCMGRIANAGLTIMASSSDDQCGKCGMTKSNAGKHCCKDEYKQVKITVDQKPSSLNYLIDAPASALLNVGWPLDFRFVCPTNQMTAYRSNAPPPLLLNRQSLFCVFRI